MNTLFLSKYKIRIILVIIATLFLAVLFLLKNEIIFQNKNTKDLENTQGLNYDIKTFDDLVNKDTDQDGILDWEEILWGTDPTKKDTNNDGISDDIEIAKIKSENSLKINGEISIKNTDKEVLTKTEEFSRDFFSTIATLSQNGEINEEIIEKLGATLAENIQNTPQIKIYTLEELNIINNDSIETIQTYSNNLVKISNKYPIKKRDTEILQTLITEEDTLNEKVLIDLDLIIKQTENAIKDLAKIAVPQSLALFHLDFLNALQGKTENLKDIRLYEVDVIVALSGISKYQKNIELLEKATLKLGEAIEDKLNN